VAILENTDWEKLVDGLLKQGILRTPRVISSMRAVPRSKFLAPNQSRIVQWIPHFRLASGKPSPRHMVAAYAEPGDIWFP